MPSAYDPAPTLVRMTYGYHNSPTLGEARVEAVMSSSQIVGVMLGAVLAVAGLGGCGKFYWGQPGATQEQFVRDNRECVKESAPTPSRTPGCRERIAPGLRRANPSRTSRTR